MPDKKKTTTDGDDERGGPESKKDRGGFADTAGPEVAGAPAEPTGTDVPREPIGAPVDDPSLPKPEDQDRIAAEEMPPLDAETVGTSLTEPDAAERDALPVDAEPGEAERADAEEAMRETPLSDDLLPSASSSPRDDATDAASGLAPEDAAASDAERDPSVDPPSAAAAAAAAAAASSGTRPTGAAADDAVRAGTPQRDIGEPGTGGAGGDGGAYGTDRHGDESADEGGRSLASSLLVALLLLIAGAAIGIWAGPRLAPHLPAGMAAWLGPQDNELETRVAALEAETGAAIADLRADLERLAAEEEDTADLDQRFADLEAQIEQRLGTLGDDLAALDGAETRDRLSRLETAVEGQQDTLASLRDQLANVDVDEATAQIDAYEAELAGLRGEFRDVAGQVGALSRRIDEVAADAQRQVEIARAEVEEIEAEAAAGLTRAEVEADLAQIRSALASGAPYEGPVERLATRTEAGVPAALADPAPQGVPTLASLRQSFPDASTRAIRADVQAGADDTFGGRLRGFLEAQVATRSLEPREGVDTDSVLSRMEAALRQDDLETALAEAEALPPDAANAMADWLEAARTRHEAVQGLEQVQADLSTMN